MMVHESDADAQTLRNRRPNGRFHSGITPPTHKITSEFLKRKPNFAKVFKKRNNNIKSTFNAITSAERHITRVMVCIVCMCVCVCVSEGICECVC